MKTIKVKGVTYDGGEFAGYINKETNTFIDADNTYAVDYNEDPAACFAVVEALAREGEVLILDAEGADGNWVFAVEPK